MIITEARYLFISCCSMKSPSFPFSAFSFKKFGKKNIFNTRNIIANLTIITVQSVLPNVMCRKPS